MCLHCTDPWSIDYRRRFLTIKEAKWILNHLPVCRSLAASIATFITESKPHG